MCRLHFWKQLTILWMFPILGGCSYQLSVPGEYTALSGDLFISYGIPEGNQLPSAFVRLFLLGETANVEITNLPIAQGYPRGVLKITCGIIEVAGKYEFRMYMHEGSRVLVRALVVVRWPEVDIRLPLAHVAQSTSVRVHISSDAVCNPLLKKFSFSLELEFAKNSSSISVSGKDHVTYSQSFTEVAKDDNLIDFSCNLFEQIGIYRVSLTSSYSAISVVARSNSMLATSNPKFFIRIYKDTIFPCSTGSDLTIDYGLGQCPSAPGSNRLRVYKLVRTAASMAAPINKMYIREIILNADSTRLNEPCSGYHTEAAGYCFQLVTLMEGGVVVNQTEGCKSAHPDSVLPIDGGWSQWSSWSNCSSTCGHGERTRYRMCDSPTPNFGGAFCQGESVQRRPCSNFCPDSIPYTPLHAPRVSIECACGCRMSGGQGEVVASGRCTGNSVWILSAPEGHVITLWFTFIDLYEGQWVKVRNGASSSADLLAFTDGRTKVESVSTSDHQMLVEFYSPPGEDGVSVYSQKATKPIHVHGFIAKFESNESTAAPASPVVVAPVVSEAPPSIWESTVTIVGISLCGLVVVTAIIFVIYHRACHSRLHKYAMAAHEESPRRMCKSTSMRSTPSHESGNHGIEIEHDMETPLTGMPPNIDNRKRAKTPGGHSNRSKGSLASVHSHHAKTCKAEVEIDREFRRPSAIHSHRDYMQVPQDASPRRTPRNHELVQAGDHNNMSLFKTSPLVKTKVPRSPKIHPSPKLKSHIHSRTHSPCDNNQKSSVPLIPKRLDSLGSDPNQRVVMGSDYTPTNSVKSPPSDSSKHDCPTPTNINFNTLNKPHTRGGGTPTSQDIKLNQLNRLPDDNERNGASGKSDNSTNADNNVTSLATTSFIENSTKPRRPTSLTESYSKMSLASIHSKASVEGSKEKTSVTSSDDRQNILPKPDGQSPKSQRLDLIKVKSHPSSPSKTSKTSTPLSAKSLRSDRTDVSGTTKSPARSINTPSDVIELEYDDFIDMDDTYSYFDPVETEKLTWHGVERVKGNTPK